MPEFGRGRLLPCPPPCPDHHLSAEEGERSSPLRRIPCREVEVEPRKGWRLRRGRAQVPLRRIPCPAGRGGTGKGVGGWHAGERCSPLRRIPCPAGRGDARP